MATRLELTVVPEPLVGFGRTAIGRGCDAAAVQP